jgi:hypothetical protein
MNRATLKVPKGTADRLSGAKLDMSADVGRQLTTGQAIDYLLAYWRITRGQAHLIEWGPDGVPCSPSNATSRPA